MCVCVCICMRAHACMCVYMYVSPRELSRNLTLPHSLKESQSVVPQIARYRLSKRTQELYHTLFMAE